MSDERQIPEPPATPQIPSPALENQGATARPPTGALDAPTTGIRSEITDDGGIDQDKPRWQTHVRRWTAGILVMLIAVGFIASRYVDDLQVCQTTPPKKRDELTQTVCKPIPVQDLAPLLLVLAALLWPDVTEIDIRGLGRIVRRLDATNEKQDEIAETQERIIGQLTQVQQIASQRVEINVADTTALAKQVDDVRVALAELQATQQVQRGEEVPTEAAAAPPSDRESLRSELLDVWRDLEPWAEFGRRQLDNRFASWAAVINEGEELPIPANSARLVQRVRAAAGGKIDLDAVRDWYGERQPQIETVRATLNELDALPDKTLRDALVLAQRALADLHRRGLTDS